MRCLRVVRCSLLPIPIFLLCSHLFAFGGAQEPSRIRISQRSPRQGPQVFRAHEAWFNVYFWDYKIGYARETRKHEWATYHGRQALKLVQVIETKVRRGAESVSTGYSDTTYLQPDTLTPLGRVKKTRLAEGEEVVLEQKYAGCLLYTSPSPRD